MLIKQASDRTRDVEALQALLTHPRATENVRSRIEQEIRNIRAGAKGESEAAYEIDFHHKASRNWAVIHDLRLEHQGRVAQIDHLIVHRTLDIWVCESKHFAEGVAINEHGEFAGFYGGRPFGVPSPIEQNRKHIAVLQAMLGSSIVNLPTRLGIPLRPTYRSVVLVSKAARISRPKAKVEGLESIIKTDQLRALIEKSIDGESVASTLLSISKIVSPETLEEFCKQVARLHRPISFNWAAKFGLDAPESNDVARSDSRARAPLATVSFKPEAMPRGPLPGTAVLEQRANVEAPQVAAPYDGRLSTSKLAAKHGLKSGNAMLDCLTSLGHLEKGGDHHRLTARGLAAGAVFVEKSRYGPYFLWPQDLPIAK